MPVYNAEIAETLNRVADLLEIEGARDMGLKLAINTDAHSVADLSWMRFGVDQARRGWLEAQDVLNTRSWSDLQELLARLAAV